MMKSEQPGNLYNSIVMEVLRVLIKSFFQNILYELYISCPYRRKLAVGLVLSCFALRL
jgi:hypothetical protein